MKMISCSYFGHAGCTPTTSAVADPGSADTMTFAFHSLTQIWVCSCHRSFALYCLKASRGACALC